MIKYEISVNNIIDRAVASVPNARYCSLWLDKHIVSNFSCDGRFQTNMLLSLDKVSLSLPYCLVTVDYLYIYFFNLNPTLVECSELRTLL